MITKSFEITVFVPTGDNKFEKTYKTAIREFSFEDSTPEDHDFFEQDLIEDFVDWCGAEEDGGIIPLDGDEGLPLPGTIFHFRRKDPGKSREFHVFLYKPNPKFPNGLHYLHFGSSIAAAIEATDE